MTEIRRLIADSQSERVLANRIYELVTRESAMSAQEARLKALGVDDLSFPDGPMDFAELGGEG